MLSCNRRGQREIGSVGVKGPDEYCQIAVIEGEICVRGSIVFQGYYRDQAATDEVKRDGWFHTGDLGRMDENGFLFLTGRKKNLIILSDGNNISPEEIEGHFAGIDLIQSMFVREKQVNGRPCIVASIYPNYELPGLSEEELRERIRDKVRQVNGQLPAYQRIGMLSFTPRILKRPHWEKFKDTNMPRRSVMLEKIRAFLVEEYGLKAEEITADKELSKDLGLTSFQLVRCVRSWKRRSTLKLTRMSSQR